MKKCMNVRFFLYLAFAMIVSTIVAVKIFVSQKSRLIAMIVLCVILIASLVWLVACKKKLMQFCFVMMLGIVIPFIGVYFKAESINKNTSLNVEKCYITGKIYKLDIELSENKVYFYLTDVVLKTDKNENMEQEKLKFKGKFLVQLNANNVDTSEFEIGKYLTVYATPKFYSLNNKSDEDLSYISRGINAKCYAYSYTHWLEDKVSLSFRDNVRNSTFKLFKKTNTFYTNIGFAMMFGETTVLQNEVYDVFTGTGIAHLLAVSGFHISIIIAFVSFILKKLKANNAVKFSVVLAVLGFYAYICDFSVSVIRASVMSLLLLYSSARNKEYDRLSALDFSCCLILLINPLNLFSVSFVLSFIAVLSIVLLMPIFERLLSKIFYPKLASTLSLSLSTSLGISVFQIFYFHKMPLLSMLSNLITVPLVSVLFVFLIVSVLIGGLFGFAVPLISVFGFFMKYILQFNYWISSIGLSINIGKIPAITLLLSLILMFVVSDYIFMKKRNKTVISSILGGILLILVVF